MAKGASVRLLRKASAFTASDFEAGEIGINTAAKRLEASPDGTELLLFPSHVRHVLRYASGSYPARPASGYVEWVGPSDPAAQGGLTVSNDDIWTKTAT